MVVLEGTGCALGVFYPSSRGRNGHESSFGKFGTQILLRALCVLLIRVEEQRVIPGIHNSISSVFSLHSLCHQMLLLKASQTSHGPGDVVLEI